MLNTKQKYYQGSLGFSIQSQWNSSGKPHPLQNQPFHIVIVETNHRFSHNSSWGLQHEPGSCHWNSWRSFFNVGILWLSLNIYDVTFNYLIKWYCRMYPEFVLIQYAKTHRHRNECHEENPFHTHRSLETGGMACHARPHEKAPSLVRKQKEIERKA